MEKLLDHVSRRNFLRNLYTTSIAIGGSQLVSSLTLATETIEKIKNNSLSSGALSTDVLEAIEGKGKLIKKTYRPVNYETPIEVFAEDITPNNMFFVRWHMPSVEIISADQWKLKIQGDSIEKPIEINLQQLKNDFPQHEVTAVCQCSGNRRKFSTPRVSGIQWGSGAMGNAVWKGARLSDILKKAKIKQGAVEVFINGYDNPGLTNVPDFQKSIPIQKALDSDVIIAYEMNGQELPHHNGFPARLVVPGWTAAYWIKQIESLIVSSKPMKSFWMNPAYRVPMRMFPLVDRFVSQEDENSMPVTELVVNSLITNIKENQKFSTKDKVLVKGIAWDGGYGISTVEISYDNGINWLSGKLEKNLGKYSWRQWSVELPNLKKGKYNIMVKATNQVGATQTFDLIFNQSGYLNNVVQKVPIVIEI